MLCTIELMLAGLCINIPMLRPYYLQWRAKYKSTSLSASGRRDNQLSGSGHLKSDGQRAGHFTQWMELVCLFFPLPFCTIPQKKGKQKNN